MKQDIEIFDLIRKEEERQTEGIELIASENFVSKQAVTATLADRQGPGNRNRCRISTELWMCSLDRPGVGR